LARSTTCSMSSACSALWQKHYAKDRNQLADAQNGGALELAGAQVLKRLVRLFKAKLTDLGADGHLGSELHELLAVSAGEVCDRAECSFTPEQVVGERRDLAHVNSGADDDSAFRYCGQRRGNELADRREDDRCVELFRRPLR